MLTMLPSSSKISPFAVVQFGIFTNFDPRNGLVAERLGTGLQNRLQRFESARDLKTLIKRWGFFIVQCRSHKHHPLDHSFLSNPQKRQIMH